MQSKSAPETSFFAKMLLLFALVFLGHPDKRKGLEAYLNDFFHRDTIHVGQIPYAKLINTNQIQSSIPQ